ASGARAADRAVVALDGVREARPRLDAGAHVLGGRTRRPHRAHARQRRRPGLRGRFRGLDEVLLDPLAGLPRGAAGAPRPARTAPRYARGLSGAKYTSVR